MKLRQRNRGGWKWWEWIKRRLAFPLQLLIRLAHWQLSKLMLLGLEVAMEYMLALLHSPQVRVSPPGTFLLFTVLFGWKADLLLLWWPRACLMHTLTAATRVPCMTRLCAVRVSAILLRAPACMLVTHFCANSRRLVFASAMGGQSAVSASLVILTSL